MGKTELLTGCTESYSFPSLSHTGNEKVRSCTLPKMNG